MKKNILTSAVLAVGLAMPMTANALTLLFQDAAFNQSSIVDGGVGDADGVVNGSILAGAINVGTSVVTIATSLFTDASGFSKLVLNVSDAIANEAFNIAAFHDFSGAAAAPVLSKMNFTMNGSEVSGQVDGHFGYGPGGSLAGLTYTAFESLFDTGDDIDQTASAPLSDPFRMIINTFVYQGTTASYDATLTATPVPLPAGGLLLLTALGGVAALRRRRKAA